MLNEAILTEVVLVVARELLHLATQIDVHPSVGCRNYQHPFHHHLLDHPTTIHLFNHLTTIHPFTHTHTKHYHPMYHKIEIDDDRE